MAISQRQISSLLKLGSVVGFIEEARVGKYSIPNYVLRALGIIESIYDELLEGLNNEDMRKLYKASLRAQKASKPIPETWEHQLISVMFFIYEIENVFKSKKRPLHYVFLVLFKYLRKKVKGNQEDLAEAIVDYALAKGYSMEHIESKARAYAEKLKEGERC